MKKEAVHFKQSRALEINQAARINPLYRIQSTPLKRVSKPQQ